MNEIKHRIDIKPKKIGVRRNFFCEVVSKKLGGFAEFVTNAWFSGSISWNSTKNTANVTQSIMPNVLYAFCQSSFFAKNRIMLGQYPIAIEKMLR
jgi:hypothetical protein